VKAIFIAHSLSFSWSRLVVPVHWSSTLALYETPDPEAVSEQANKKTDLLTPRELANEFHRVLDKREQMRQERSEESV
jgi:hypothetical protein